MTSVLVPHLPSSAAHVRAALARELRAAGVAEDVVDDALLVVSELVGNAVQHGRPLPGGSVRASWWVAGGAVHLEVCDAGSGPTPAGEWAGAASRGLDEVGPAQPLPGAEGGRGLSIVDLLSTRWGTTAPSPSDAVGVWAEIPLPGATPSALSRGGRARPSSPLPRGLRARA